MKKLRKRICDLISGSGILPEPEELNSAYYRTKFRCHGGIRSLIKYALALCLELSDECDCEDSDYPEKEESPHNRDIS